MKGTGKAAICLVGALETLHELRASLGRCHNVRRAMGQQKRHPDLIAAAPFHDLFPRVEDGDRLNDECGDAIPPMMSCLHTSL